MSFAQIREGEDRFTPSPDGTVAPPTRRCTVDSFSIAVTCHEDCLMRNSTTGCVIGCDRECNRTMSSKLKNSMYAHASLVLSMQVSLDLDQAITSTQYGILTYCHAQCML